MLQRAVTGSDHNNPRDATATAGTLTSLSIPSHFMIHISLFRIHYRQDRWAARRRGHERSAAEDAARPVRTGQAARPVHGERAPEQAFRTIVGWFWFVRCLEHVIPRSFAMLAEQRV